MRNSQYHSPFGGANSLKSFFKQIPVAIRVYLGVVFGLFVLHELLAMTTGFALMSYLGFTPALIIERYFVFQFLSGPFVAGSLINVLSLVVFMIFFGMSYNRQYGDRYFVNVIIQQTLMTSVLYLAIYLGVQAFSSDDAALYRRFNTLDLTHSLRIVLIVLWGADFWRYEIIPPIRVWHLVVLFLLLDVIAAYKSIQFGMLAPAFELSGIAWGYLIWKHQLPLRYDIASFFNRSKKVKKDEKKPSFKVVK